MVDENVPVLIVGGSLVGLSTAVAALTSRRTVEAYRTVGLQAEVEAWR